MTDDPHINFRQQVAADPKARAKWQEVSDEALAAIEADYGVRLDRERLLESSAIKLNVLASADMEWRADIEALPEVAQAIENKRLLAALNDPKDRLHEDANAALMALKPEERISAARQMGGVVGHVRGSTTRRNLSAQEREAALIELQKYPRSMRVDMARKLGLE